MENETSVVPDLESPAPVEEETLISEEEETKALEKLLLDAREEDRFVRDSNLLVWKRLEYYWNNIIDIFYDPSSHSWQVPDWDELVENDELPPRLINIYRPHGEAIVAALTVTLPGVFFHPKDADNPNDIEAAKAYRSIVDLLALHNDASMLLIKCIVKFFNQGTIFGYNYYVEDKKYGTNRIPKIEVKEQEAYTTSCPECGAPLDGGFTGMEQQEYECDICGYTGPGEIKKEVQGFPQIVGYDEAIKGSISLDIFSGLNIKVPMTARKQPECGYLLLNFYQSVPMLRSIFYKKLEEMGDDIERASYQSFEDFFASPVNYLGELPENSASVDCLWLRSWQFFQLGKDKAETAKSLAKKYPNGCYALFVNGRLMDIAPEDMDEHWTISPNPLGDFIYAKPLGENLATIQDIRAQLVEIELQTAEHGIPETFADGRVLDFQQYGQGRSRPGMVTQVKPRPGKSISDAFYTNKSAILSQEIEPLREHIDQDGQFVVGSFPSVYGGPAQGGSKTFGEYSQSRAMALQRLGTFWKIICEFWANFMSRAAVEYANVIKESGADEKFTKREGDGNFINIWIRNASLSGEVGRVEPESSEQLPISWSQKKDAIMQLFQTANDVILEVLTHPNNASTLKGVLGLPEIFIPGEDSRIRQRKEYVLLSQGIPVPTNPEVDNEEIHVEVLRSILEGPLADGLSDEGREAAMMHLQMHLQSLEAPVSAPEEVPQGV